MKSVFYLALLCLVFINIFSANAQHQEVNERPEMYKSKGTNDADSLTLLGAFKGGQLNGHFRYFFMNTINQGDLTDYYANAVGGGLRFETAKFHNFSFAISGFYIFNVGSSDFTKPDPQSAQFNRYEIGLFDIENPGNKLNIKRLEELHIKYNFKKSSIKFGRQLLNTPFINLQDGRMRPTGVNALWTEINEFKNLKIEGGWIHAISPRSTTRWYSIGESMGIYPSGLNTDGSPSKYYKMTDSKGIALLSLQSNISKRLKVQLWEMYTENVFNTAMLQADLSVPLKNRNNLIVAAQVIRQDALKDGGNSDQSLSYFLKDGKSLSFGAKIALKSQNWETSLNYNRITGNGRYLLPREWGRDPFFTFMPRERNEGLGDTHSIMAKIDYKVPQTKFKASLALGYNKLPDVKNFTLNKYAFPSYTQINTDFRYTFGGGLKGLEAQLLLVSKINAGETYGNSKMVINKVDMFQSNFVLNFHF